MNLLHNKRLSKVVAVITIIGMMSTAAGCTSTTKSQEPESSNEYLNYFMDVNELGGTYGDINKRLELKAIGGVDLYVCYQSKDKKYCLDFIGESVSDESDDEYRMPATAKCQGMHGAAKDLLGVTQPISVRDFEKVFGQLLADADTGCITLEEREELQLDVQLPGTEQYATMAICDTQCNGEITPETIIEFTPNKKASETKKVTIDARSGDTYDCIKCDDTVYCAAGDGLYSVQFPIEDDEDGAAVIDKGSSISNMQVYDNDIYYLLHEDENTIEYSVKKYDPDTNNTYTFAYDAVGDYLEVSEDGIKYSKFKDNSDGCGSEEELLVSLGFDRAVISESDHDRKSYDDSYDDERSRSNVEGYQLVEHQTDDVGMEFDYYLSTPDDEAIYICNHVDTDSGM